MPSERPVSGEPMPGEPVSGVPVSGERVAGVAVREAATVVLLRDGADGLETWLMRRVPRMAFAPGMSVFPGGGVDPVDATGPRSADEAAVAAQLGVTAEHAAVLLRTAAREIAEETDVRLPLEAIRPWARWITPPAETRRYDAYFFVAVLPDRTLASHISGEASVAGWLPVAQALAEYREGTRPMLPPTVRTLMELSGHPTAAEVLAAAGSRTIRPITPVLRQQPAGDWVADLGDGTVLPLPAGFITATGRRLP
ncbi:MAG TPA: NUDIX hydrolase [Jatrophihabitans sp.]|nr:NUDIX hydrolase [Jatrophihabitans sp.]